MIRLQDILLEMMLEKKADRCKRIADRKYDKPSAYKSGAIVRCRKGKIWKGLKEDAHTVTEIYDQNIIKQIFQSNSELASIGTPQQYSDYLDTIFPSSKIKDIVYRGDKFKYDVPKDPKIGIYFTLNKGYAQQYSGNITSALINTDNPLYISESPQYYWNRISDKTDRLSNYDSVIYNKGEEIVISSQQVYVLGSKQDIENFQQYMGEEITEAKKETLRTWFKRKGAPGKTGGWVDCNTCRTDKKTGRKKCKPCGRKKGETRAKYPSCRPTPSQCSQPGKGKKWGKTK